MTLQSTGCLAAALTLIICALPGYGQQRTLLVTDHPRVFFTAVDFDRIKASGFASDNLLGMTEFTLRYFGGKEVTFDCPPSQPGKIDEPPGFDSKSYGHYPYWTSLSGTIEGHLKNLSLSYVATGRREFADKAAEYCLKLVGWEVWTDPDYSPKLTPCLDTGHITIGVSIAYDVCHDAWTEQQRAQVREGLVRLGLRSLYTETTLEENQNSDANWDILYNGALGIGALALLGDDPALDDELWAAVDQARDYYLRLLDAKLTSPNTEGLAYSSSLDHGVRFADALKRVTGNEDFFTHPYVGEYIPRWITYFLSPDGRGCVNFCDAGGYPKPFITMLKLISNNYDSQLAGWLLGKMGVSDESNFEGILYGNADRKASPPPDDWPRSGLIDNIGWAALRSGWDAKDTLLAFKCSSSKHGHDHFDAGNFILNRAGTWLATDLGYGSFRSAVEGRYSRGTAGHNCILIDGQVQATKDGSIADFHASEHLDYVLGEYAACYPKGLADRMARHIIYVKPDYYIIYDECAAPEPHQFQWLLHADREARWQWDDSEPTVGETRPVSSLTITRPGAQLVAHLLAPALVEAAYAPFPGTEENYLPYMSVVAPEKATECRYVTALAAKQIVGDDISNADFEWGADGWNIGHDGPSEVKLSVDEQVKHSGRQSIKLVGEVPERDRTLLGQWYVPATEGALYRAGVWARCDNLTGGTPVIDLTFYGPDKKPIPPYYAERGQNGTADWHKLQIEGRAPAGATLMTLRVGYNRCAGTMWLDGAELVQVDPPRVTHEQLDWSFAIEGDPAAGAFAIRATAEGREDLLVCNFTDAAATIAGVQTENRLTLRRTVGGVQTVAAQMR